MDRTEIIEWLLEGDVSIQYQVHRDLLATERPDLQERIATEGWGANFLAARKPNGHWGLRFYQPKWTSSHYTLLDLRNLCIAPTNELAGSSATMIARTEMWGEEGGEPYSVAASGDLCVIGMFLNYASYFNVKEELLGHAVDRLLAERMPDGGFNCRLHRSGAVHSSLHTSLSVVEGIAEYLLNGYAYRRKELTGAKNAAEEFIQLHQLFISDRTGGIINTDFLKLSYPGRWKYDILRALDHCQHAGKRWDERMRPAIDVLLKKRWKDGTWPMQAKHPGQVHFEMEKAGRPSRWNTLRALRVMKHFGLGSELL